MPVFPLLIAICCLLLALIGCQPGSVQPAHTHDELPAHQVTVWEPPFEIFTEYQIPVVDIPVTFITHVSFIDSVSPRATGMIKYQFRQGDRMMEHPQASPSSPGIYLPEIRFPSAGTWQARLVVPHEGTNHSIELSPVGKCIVRSMDDDHTTAFLQVLDKGCYHRH